MMKSQELTIDEVRGWRAKLADQELFDNAHERADTLQAFINNHYQACKRILEGGQCNFETENYAKDYISGYWEVNGG